mmetsp:Transcript_23779/g.62176  ORF Transcript_23779/g.62176 Transcript_23779/m.62176 type:complete len:226 (+) Transcript_23779:1272-1949(+)
MEMTTESENGYTVSTLTVPCSVNVAVKGAISARSKAPPSPCSITLFTIFGHPCCMLAVQHPKLGATPNPVESAPSVCQTWSRRPYSALISLACWRYWCAHDVGVMVPGSELYWMRSCLSRNTGSPVTRKMCCREYICSTTAHSSMPRFKFRPPKHSSAENIPWGWPWYLSCVSIFLYDAALSVAFLDWRYHVAQLFVPIALFTPWSYMVQPPTLATGNLGIGLPT